MVSPLAVTGAGGMLKFGRLVKYTFFPGVSSCGASDVSHVHHIEESRIQKLRLEKGPGATRRTDKWQSNNMMSSS